MRLDTKFYWKFNYWLEMQELNGIMEIEYSK